MAELNDYQIQWIETTAGKKIDKKAIDHARDAELAKQKKLDELIGGKLASMKGAIADAQNFTIQKKNPDAFMKGLWSKICGKPDNRDKFLKWHASDADLQKGTSEFWGSNKNFDQLQDIEVDTRNDLIDIEAVPETKLDALADAYEQIMGIHRQMLEEYDSEGNRVYSDEDIMRSLWTPLVRDGTIPENMVPDRFSETQRMIDGAMGMYGERLEDFCKKSRGNEKLMKWMNVAKDTVALAGTIGSNVVTIQDAKELATINDDYAKGNIDKSTEEGKQLLTRKAEIETKAAMTKFAVTAMTGTMDLAVTYVDEATSNDRANWTKIADKTLDNLGKMAVSAIGPFYDIKVTGMEDKGTLTDRGKECAAFSKALQACVAGCVSSARMLPAAVNAARETEPAKRRKALGDMVDRFADAVGNCFVVAAQRSFESPPEKGAMIMWGSIAKTAIRTVGNADLILKAIESGKPAEAAMRLGGAALEGIMAAAARDLQDAMKRDATQEEMKNASFFERQFMEKKYHDDTTGTMTEEQIAKKEEGYQSKTLGKQYEAASKLIETLNKNLETIEGKAGALLDGRTPPPVDEAAEAAAREMAAQTEEMVRKKAEADIEKTFGDPKAVQEMFSKWDEEIVGYEKLYDEATPESPVDGTPPSEVEKSLEAIDKVMERSAELRARAEMINSITSSAAGIVGALIPGGGAVAAVQKMVYDLYLLQRAVAAHNQWCESMEFAFRANSAYGPAIRNTMHNAKITLSQKSVNIVLDACKVGSETARMFDPTGAATISSAVTSISQALFDYGYKRWKEAEIARGWNAYKAAREDPRNRKVARRAMQLNSTLAKYCVAYGATVAGDVAAREAIRRSGISAGMLADDKDVCKRLVSFLEQQLSDDPVVLQAEKLPHKWQPGKPEMTPDSWFRIKATALTDAQPPIAKASASTPAVDRIFATLSGPGCWNGHPTYAAWRKDFLAKNDEAEPKDRMDVIKVWEKKKDVAEQTVAQLKLLVVQMNAYTPMQAGASALPHKDMIDIARTYVALAQLMLPAAQADAAEERPELPQTPLPVVAVEDGDGSGKDGKGSEQGKDEKEVELAVEDK